MKILEEFKKFAVKGNVVDMGIGIIIGGAFGTIVSSLVKDIVMPPIGLLTGGIDFSSMVWTLKKATDTTGAVTMNYGVFINNIITFVIVAFTLFLLIKWMNKIQEAFDKEEEEKPAPAKTPEDIVLLTEIRDALKETKDSN